MSTINNKALVKMKIQVNTEIYALMLIKNYQWPDTYPLKLDVFMPYIQMLKELRVFNSLNYEDSLYLSIDVI